MESSKLPESACEFVPQGTDGEMLMPRDCPEFSNPASCGMWPCSLATRTTPACTLAAFGGEIRFGAAIGVAGTAESPESACEFVPQGTGDEMLMPRDCPEFSNPASCGMWPRSPATRTTPPCTLAAFGGEIRLGAAIGVPGTAESPESACEFVPQGTGDETLMPKDCLEFRLGKAESGNLKIEIGVEMREMTESRCDFVLQGADGELVMSHDCLEIPRLKMGFGSVKGAGSAPTGLRNVMAGLPRASLADSLCPGLTSGCAFGAERCGRMMSSRRVTDLIAAAQRPLGEVKPWFSELFEPPQSPSLRWIWRWREEGTGSQARIKQ